MGFLDILCYIGVGLGVAGLLILISYLWSRPKETVLYEDGSVEHQRGEGSWVGALVFSTFIMCVIATLLLYNLAHFSILKSIGLSLLGSIVWFFLLLLVLHRLNKYFLIHTIIDNLLNGAGFAILAVVWGWF